MNLAPSQKATTKKVSLREVLSVREFPEMAFQSYEMLKNNASSLKNDFLEGNFQNPKLEYPELHSPETLKSQIDRLEDGIALSKQYSDKLGESGINAVESSLGFRANEMHLVGLFATLNEAVSREIPQEQMHELANETRDLNEKLYGKPNPETLKSSLGHIWQNIDNKQLSESATEIKNQLENGFTWGNTQIGGLPKPEKFEALPDFENPALSWAGEAIMAETAPIEALIREMWEDKVTEFGEKYEAGPEDIVEMFAASLQLMDPGGETGVKAEIDPGATALSWDSSTMSIKVGSKRKSIDSAEALYRKFLHEGYIHGGRAINGLKTELPVLGTGLFTDTERADYLTFEEGLATTIEEAVSGTEPKWNSVKLGNYINIGLAEQGYDFRSVFEVSWRYRLLEGINDNQEVDDALLEKHKNAAYTACVRIFRGTPTDLCEKYPGIKPVTYNKDLAYLNGRKIAMDYLAKLYENQDKDGLIRLMSAKFDPTVPEQDQLVDTFSVKKHES